jgi:hypothetical protein
MYSLFTLYILNLIGDYPLQGNFLSEFKAKSNYVLYVHAMIWTGTVALGLVIFGLFAWWKILFLLIGHMAIDAWKCRHHYEKMGLSDYQSYYIDQFLHVVQLLIVWGL